MAIRVVCAACSRAVRVSDNLAGRKLSCPDCGKPIVVVAESSADARPEPRATTAARPERPVKKRPAPPTEVDEEDEPEVTVRRVSRPRRKKRRRRARETEQSYDWVWWVVCGVTAAVAVGLLFAVGYAKNDPLFVAINGIALGIMLVISCGILIVSMIISSAIIGGIDFGEIHIVIPKALVLLLIVDSIIILVPYGGFVTLPIWIIGLMVFFRLDFVETRLLFVVNWVLNYGANWVLMAMLLNHAAHINKKDQPNAAPPNGQQTEEVDDMPQGLGR